MLEVNQADEGTVPFQTRPDSSSMSGLSAFQRLEVINAGRTAKNLAFGGILFLDGELIPPRTWQAQADQFLVPDNCVTVEVKCRYRG